MFENLSVRALTWRREPALYVALAVAVLNLVLAGLQGDAAWADVAESVVALLAGFLIRGRVTPV